MLVVAEIEQEVATVAECAGLVVVVVAQVVVVLAVVGAAKAAVATIAVHLEFVVGPAVD